MWPSRLFWKLFLVYAGLNLALALGFLIVVSNSLRDHIIDHVHMRLHDSAVILKRHVNDRLTSEQSSELQKIVVSLGKQMNQTRLTLVDATGLVLADSDRDPSAMGNHRHREEFKKADENKGVGSALRRSPTLGSPMYYVAILVPPTEEHEHAYVRAAMPLDSIDQQVEQVKTKLWTLATIVGIAALISTYAVVRHLMRPLSSLTEAVQAMASGDYSTRPLVRSGDEFGVLAKAFEQMQRQLSQQVHQLRETGQRQSTVLGSMVEGVIAVDAQQRILLANDASKKMLDFATGDPIGRPLLEITRIRQVHDAVLKAVEHHRPLQLEFEVPGSTRQILSLRATRLPGSPSPGVVTVLHDITELMQLENMRRDFVANVSHELKTPLTAIKAYAETLRLGASTDPENNLRFIKQNEEQADRLHQLIRDLLHLARVESDQEAFEIADVSIEEIVDLCVSQHLSVAAAQKITLEVHPPDQKCTVRADAQGVATILDNLLDNAIKYTPEGGKISVSWHPVDNMIELVVKDSGFGITPAEQLRVFERFYRIDKARSRDIGGTGLGLSIVKHLAQAFGGSVGLASREGQGSSFRVKLPQVTGLLKS